MYIRGFFAYACKRWDENDRGPWGGAGAEFMMDIRSFQQLFQAGNNAGNALRGGRSNSILAAFVAASVGVSLAGHLAGDSGRRRRIYRRFLRGLARRRTPVVDTFLLNPF